MVQQTLIQNHFLSAKEQDLRPKELRAKPSRTGERAFGAVTIHDRNTVNVFISTSITIWRLNGLSHSIKFFGLCDLNQQNKLCLVLLNLAKLQDFFFRCITLFNQMQCYTLLSKNKQKNPKMLLMVNKPGLFFDKASLYKHLQLSPIFSGRLKMTSSL